MTKDMRPDLTSWFDQNDSGRPRGRRAVTRVFEQSLEDIIGRFADEVERRNAALDQGLELSLTAASEIKELSTGPTPFGFALRIVLETPTDAKSEADHHLDEAFLKAKLDGRLDRRLGFYLRSILLHVEEFEFQRQEALEQALQCAWGKALRKSDAA